MFLSCQLCVQWKHGGMELGTFLNGNEGGTHLGVFETTVGGDEKMGVRGPRSEVCVCVCIVGVGF